MGEGTGLERRGCGARPDHQGYRGGKKVEPLLSSPPFRLFVVSLRAQAIHQEEKR